MSTSPGDNDSTDDTRTPNEAPKPTFEPGVATEVPRSGTDHLSGGAGSGASAPDAPGAAPGPAEPTETAESAAAAGYGRATSGLFSTETFAIVGIALLAVTVLSGQLLEILTSMLLVGGQPIGPDQVTQITTQIVLGGAVALLALLVSVLALALSGVRTQPWARWLATAAAILGGLFVVVAAVSFLLVPEAGPAMPPMME